VLLLRQVQIDLVVIYKLRLKEEHIMFLQEILIMVVVHKAVHLLQVLHQIIHHQEADLVLSHLQEVIVHHHIHHLRLQLLQGRVEEVHLEVLLVVEVEVLPLQFQDPVN
jgi:hypothetical protein